MLKEMKQIVILFMLACLNPYFNGTCSKSENGDCMQRLRPCVLILILMEHAQRADFDIDITR